MQQPHALTSSSVVNPAAVLIHGTEEVEYVTMCACGSRFTARDLRQTVLNCTKHVNRLSEAV